MDSEIDAASITDQSTFIHQLLELEQRCNNDALVGTSFLNLDVPTLFECQSESGTGGVQAEAFDSAGESQLCRKRSKEAVRKMRWRQGLSGPQKEIIKKREREQKRRRFTNLTHEEKMAHRAKDRLRKARERQLESAEQKKQRLERERIRKQNLRMRRKSGGDMACGNKTEVENDGKQQSGDEMKNENDSVLSMEQFVCNQTVETENAVGDNMDVGGPLDLGFQKGGVLGLDLDMEPLGLNDTFEWNTNEPSALNSVQHGFIDETQLGCGENDGHLFLDELMIGEVNSNKLL